MDRVQHSVGCPAVDYASMSAEVVKAYAQQAQEMVQACGKSKALSRLQQAGADTFAAMQEIESQAALGPCLEARSCRLLTERRGVKKLQHAGKFPLEHALLPETDAWLAR